MRIVGDDGIAFYSKDGVLHRTSGPAFINNAGDEYWFKKGQYHRENGAAIKYKESGHKLYFVDGIKIFEGKLYDEIRKKEMALERIHKL